MRSFHRNPERVTPPATPEFCNLNLVTKSEAVNVKLALSACIASYDPPVPQSLSAVYIHLVYSTKERRPFLKDETIRVSAHRYLGGISKKLGCAPIITGGVEDHIHMLARFGRTITQAEWVKELKRVSSLWLKKEHRIRQFEWQGGYAAFSVSQSDLDQVRKYIANQAEHHKRINFQDELRLLLKQHRVEWDERYIWE